MQCVCNNSAELVVIFLNCNLSFWHMQNFIVKFVTMPLNDQSRRMFFQSVLQYYNMYHSITYIGKYRLGTVSLSMLNCIIHANNHVILFLSVLLQATNGDMSQESVSLSHNLKKAK
jgi:hypothetical protein